MKNLFIAITSLMAFSFAQIPEGESAESMGYKLTKKSIDADSGFKTEQSTMKMLLINAHGDQSEREMIQKVIEVKNDGDRSIIEFISPADVRGTKLLTWSHSDRNDDQWLYMPALRRIKRIASSGQTGSFMGSEFSYEDIGSEEIEKFTYKYLGDEKIEDRPAYKIERYPVDEDSGYSKQVVWMDQQHLRAVKVDYYDRKGVLLKTAEFGDFKKVNGYWRTDKLVMSNHQTGKKSILSWADRKIGAPLSMADFQSANLSR